MLQKALGCLFVFGIAPVGIGGLWTKGMGQKREKILNLYLAGFLSELAVFQLIAVHPPYQFLSSVSNKFTGQRQLPDSVMSFRVEFQ